MTTYWDKWDALPDREKTAHIAALYEKAGYDPEESRKEDRIRKLEERVKSLELELATVRKMFQQMIDAEADRRQQLRHIQGV